MSKKLEETINLVSQILQISVPFVRKFIAEILLKRYFARILLKWKEISKKVKE